MVEIGFLMLGFLIGVGISINIFRLIYLIIYCMIDGGDWKYYMGELLQFILILCIATAFAFIAGGNH